MCGVGGIGLLCRSLCSPASMCLCCPSAHTRTRTHARTPLPPLPRAARRDGRALLVCPTNVTRNWLAEFRKWWVDANLMQT